MGRKITLVLEVVVPEEEYEKAMKYVDNENIYDLLDMAEDYQILEVEEED